MDNEKAYHIFTMFHIPLYTAILILLLSSYKYVGFYITDGFLIVHMLMHLCFHKHPDNNFSSVISKAYIYLPGILACAHIALLLFFH